MSKRTTNSVPDKGEEGGIRIFNAFNPYTPEVFMVNTRLVVLAANCRDPFLGSEHYDRRARR